MARNLPLIFAEVLAAGVLITKGARMFAGAFGQGDSPDSGPESLGQAATGSGGGPAPLGQGSLSTIWQAATELAQANPSYVWGGGHGSNALRGADCSGAISYVLARAGLLKGSLTSGQFMSYGQPGEGEHVTIWASPTHVIMSIRVAGIVHWFGTSGFGHPDAPNGTGANWFDPKHQPSAGYLSAFTPRHPPGL